MRQSRIIIRRAGLGASLQDKGRPGFLRYGLGMSGPMDWARAMLALQLAGAGADAPFFEITIGGLEFDIKGSALPLGFAGPGFNLSCNEKNLSGPCRFTAPEGARIQIRPGKRGLWAYLAFGGECDLAPVLGAYATHARAGLSAFAMQAGAELAFRPLPAGDADHLAFADPCGAPPERLAITRAPQWAMFSPAAHKALLAGAWRIARRWDRMGYWLEGPKLAMRAGHDVPSEGMALGAIEVSGDGRAVVVLADGQPTGGYPKIAVIARADLPHFVQKRPGEAIGFCRTDIATATASYLDLRQKLEAMPSGAPL